MSETNGDLTKLEQRVWDEIQHFDKLALRATGNVLAAYCDTTRRTIQRVVNSLRKKGYPVGSSSGGYYGYFVARTPGQVAATVKHLEGRVREAEDVLRRFKRHTRPAVEEALGQERMVSGD